jgi:hypothetical protein
MSRIARRLKVSLYESLFAMLLGPILTAYTAVFSPASAHVHHSPDGTSVNWYPIECCHDGDCHPASRVQALSDGFLMTTEDGTTLFVNSQKLRRQSLDNRWHVCFGSGEYPAVLCIFEPPSS